jgi:hypothetical protein
MNSAPMFQKRHYEAVATLLQERLDAAHRLEDKEVVLMVTDKFLTMFSQDNGRFNSERFIKAVRG